MMEKIKVVICGCGGIAGRWFANAAGRDDADIVGVVDILSENTAKAKAKYELNCGVYEDLAEAIAKTRPDVVFNITPPSAHFEVVTAALKNGCACFSEKPLSDSMESAYELIRISDDTGQPFFVMQNRRYNKYIHGFKSLFCDEIIGKPGILNSDFYIGAHFGGFRDAMDSPLIMDMAIHTFDQARFLTGANPVSVYCHEYNPAWSWYARGASATCIFEFDNGVLYTYRGSWCGDGCSTSWDANWRAVGKNGTAVWENDTVVYAEVVDNAAEQTKLIRKVKRVEPDLSYAGRAEHDGCIDAMFEALKRGKRAETDCRDNVKSLEMVFKAIESAKTGKRVYW